MKALPICAALILAATLATPGNSGTRPWTSDDLLALKTVSEPQLSPDGRWVAYVVSELNYDRSEYQTDVWLVPSAGGEARRLTNSPAADESPRWSPDGTRIAFLSERPRPDAKKDDGSRDKDPGADEAKRQLWLIHVDGGEAWQLSDAKGGVSAFEWSRDGARIAYLSKEPKSEERRKKEKEKDDAWTPSTMYPWNRLWVIEVATRKSAQLTSGEFHVTGFSFSPDGRRLAIAAQPTPLIPDNYNSDLYLIPVTGGKPAPLVQRPGTDNQPHWSPDGRWIAFVSQDGRSTEWFTNNYICLVPPSGGPPRNLTAGHDERVEGLGAGGLEWSPDASHVLFASFRHTSQQIFRAYVDGRPVEPVSQGPAVNVAPSYDARGLVMAFLRQDGEHPLDVYCMRTPEGAPERVTDANPQARDMLSFKKEPVSWKGPDGMPIEGLVIYPVGYRSGQKVPLVLNVHGGPAGVHSNTCTVASRVYPWALFAQKGYAILLPNPRGSGGYGEAFRAANRRDWGGKDYEDLMAGVDALIARGIADKERLAVCGWSYGGFMTSTIVTKTDRFRAAVVGAGVTDLISMVGTCDIPEFNRSYFDSWPWQDPEFYVDHSAVLHAGHVKTPTLVVHGEKDDRVPTSQGWEFYTALRKVGVATDLLLLPRQPHGPREPRLLKTVQEWHLDWIDKHTLGAAPVARRAAKPAGETKAAAGTSQ